MKLELSVRAYPLLLAAGVLIGACSSDPEPLTLDEYFAEFDAIDDDVDSQFEALFADFPDDEDAWFADEACAGIRRMRARRGRRGTRTGAGRTCRDQAAATTGLSVDTLGR